MQYARFKNLQRVIQQEYVPNEVKLVQCQGCKVRLDLTFPAFVRTFYNCPSKEARKRLVRAVARLARNSLPERPVLCRNWAPEQFDRDELYKLFTSNPVPWPISKNVREFPPVGLGACYVGGLRFEVLRNTYKGLFVNTIPGSD
jgi:hypothetical protein